MEKTKEFIRSNYWSLPRDELRKLLGCLNDDDFWEIISKHRTPQKVHYNCILIPPTGLYQEIAIYPPTVQALDPGPQNKVVTFTLDGVKTEKGTTIWMAVHLDAKNTDHYLAFPVFTTQEEALRHLEKLDLAAAYYNSSTKCPATYDDLKKFLLEGNTFDREWAIRKLTLP